ncbi:MAG: DUF1552 domain-containing protein [Deltaproteobacteria bacterium]|nr:DUF1552 domain-containing protein [Deltaproteobacteria bacterium]
MKYREEGLLQLRRRRFLQACGLGAGSLFLPSLSARAQAAPPKRLVVLYTQHGFVYDSVKMRPPGTNETADFDVAMAELDDSQLSRVLRPLAPFKDRLSVVDGLAMVSAEGDIAFNEHEKGARHALTGATMIDDPNGALAGAASFDQVIARAIAKPGRLDSLEFAVTETQNGGGVYRGVGQPIPPDDDPRGAFSRLFPPAQGGGELSTADKVRLGQKSVLDRVAQQYDKLLPRLSGEDSKKLALHRDLVRSAELRVQALQDLQCGRPDEPSIVNDFNSVQFYESRFDAFVDLTAAALACDLTRVVTIQMSQLRNDHLGIAGDVHADFAHNSDTNAESIEVMSKYGEVHGEHMRRLLVALDSVPEGNGSLLDNCAVLWCSELANGTHGYNLWPGIVAGGAGGALRTGRYLRFVPDTPNPTQNPQFGNVEPIIGRPHNQLLTSLAKAVGADVDAIGTSELFTTEGVRVPLTGAIDELLT